MRCLAAFLVALGLALAPNVVPAQDQPAKPGNLVIDVLDVGQGDAILIRSPEGKAALIDAGPSKDVVHVLRRRGVTSIDLVAVSHHHADHYGGMDDVIREFRPRYFLATNSSHTTPTYLKLLRLVRDSGMTAIFPTDAARKIELGSVILTILPQPPEDKRDENDNSMGLRVQYGNFSVLLTGDSQAKERAYWEDNCPELIRDCTVLKLAHHGSRNGTDARWLRIVRPRLAVASLGATNDYGHPHAQTLALLERRGIPLLRTDIDGTVTIVSDGKTWEVVGRQPQVRGPPGRGERAGRETPKNERGTKAPTRLIDVNKASLEELESLPGVGQVIARRIIEGRPYGSVDDLRRVKGIGEKRLAEMQPYVTAN
jgi:beta-lactamase superfamily II metal-dependent hydrolase